jgi:hypothetical protein
LVIEALEPRQLLTVVSPLLTADANPLVVGDSLRLAAVMPSDANGTIQFKDNGSPIGQEIPVQAPSLSTALTFDGQDGSYVDLGQRLDFAKESQFSVSFWMNSTFGDQQMIIGKGIGFFNHDSPGWTVFSAGGDLYFQLNAGNYFQSSELQAWENNTAICDGQWHHVVVSYGGTSQSNGVAMYVDGNAQPIGTDSDNLWLNEPTNVLDATIGGTAAGTHCFNGDLQEVVVYDRALTAADVSTLYAGGAGDYGSGQKGGRKGDRRAY